MKKFQFKNYQCDDYVYMYYMYVSLKYIFLSKKFIYLCFSLDI
jgi:hypothetical protein